MMRSNVAATLATVTVLALVLGGCSTDQDAGSDPNNPNQVEVVTWWSTGFERAAFDGLIDNFEADNPSIQFIDASVRGAGGQTARRAISARLAAGNPPDSFQVVAGADLREYVANGGLQDLTSFYADNGLTDAFRTTVLESLTVNGEIYAVPSDVHRVNVMWTDDRLLRQAGIDPTTAPPDISAWIADLERVRDSGVEYPLAVGDELSQLTLFENVLLSELGAIRYQQLWKLASSWGGDRLSAAIDDYSRLLEFADPSSASEGWSETIQRVANGHAAYVLSADNAYSAFQRAGYTYGTQFSAHPMPGTAGVFDFVADAFTLPVGAVHDASAREWLLTVSSTEGQEALSLLLGSVPARTDAVATDYSPYQQTAIASMKNDTMVPSLAYGVAATPEWTSAIAAAVIQFRKEGHREALTNAMTAAADSALE